MKMPDKNPGQQLNSADKAKDLIAQKKEREQQEAEQKKEDESKKAENVQNNLQEVEVTIDSLGKEQEQLRKDLEQATQNIEEKFEVVRGSVTDLQNEDLLEGLDAEERESVFGDDSLEITALQENKKALEEKINKNESRLAELESQKKELFHQTPEGEKEKIEEIKNAIKEKLNENRITIRPLEFDGMESLKKIGKQWLEKDVAKLYDEFDRDQIKSVLVDEYGQDVNKYFNTERELVESLTKDMEAVKNQSPRYQDDTIRLIQSSFASQYFGKGGRFLESAGLNKPNSLAEVQRALKEKELQINQQQKQAMEVIDLAIEHKLLGGPDALSEFQDIDHFSKVKSQKESFERNKNNAKEARYEAMSLDTKLNDKLGNAVVLVDNSVQFEGKLNEIDQHNKDLDQAVKDLEQELRTADSEYNTEKDKKPWFGKDKHQSQVDQLKTTRDNLEQQLNAKSRERNIDTNEAFPPLYSYFEKLGDSQYNSKKQTEFYEQHREELASGMTLGNLLDIMRKEAEEKESQKFSKDKQEMLDKVQEAEKHLDDAISKYAK